MIGLLFLKEMKEQMSSPAAASLDRKNKQVTKHPPVIYLNMGHADFVFMVLIDLFLLQ